MKHRALALLFAAALSGCATFDESELATIQRSGVSPRIVSKMEAGRVLTPEDVIELTRRRVPNNYILRQIEDAGVDYLLSPEDYQRLQKARVAPEVLDALLAASDDFAARYAAPVYRPRVVDPYYDDAYYAPHPHPYVSGSAGIGFSSARHGRWRH